LQKIKFYLIPLILGIIIYSCEKEDSTVIDPVLNFPAILSHYITPVVLNSDTVSCIAGATVESIDPVGSVEVKFYDLNNNVLTIGLLHDNGVFPDTTAGDGKYTGYLTYVFTCREVGNHNVEFLATSTAGLTSNPILETVTIQRIPNDPPVVSGIVITPDSTQQSIDVFLIFMITATDPNGYCDIGRVFYSGFSPGGTALTPRDLFDDGSCCPVDGTTQTSGDTTAFDNKYTRKLFGGPPELGYYRYYIKAVDRSGDTSNILSDSIYVYP